MGEKRKRKNKKKNKVKLQVPSCDESLTMAVSGCGNTVVPVLLEQPPGLTADVSPGGAQSEGIGKGGCFPTPLTAGVSPLHGEINGRTHWIGVSQCAENDRREEYIQHLEEENRYLRACLIQYVGPVVGSMLTEILAGKLESIAS